MTTWISLAILLASWAFIAMLPTSLLALFFGIILLDIAVQAIHVTNQSMILNRYPEMSGRLVGGYVAFYAIGSAIGALSSTTVYVTAGWSGVCMLGAGFSAAALLIWGGTLKIPLKPVTTYRTDSPSAALSKEAQPLTYL